MGEPFLPPTHRPNTRVGCFKGTQKTRILFFLLLFKARIKSLSNFPVKLLLQYQYFLTNLHRVSKN